MEPTAERLDGLRSRFQLTRVRSALETRVLSKLRSLESILRPINRLPADIFILIPDYFANDSDQDYETFPINKPLITMTHVCRSWRNLLLSTTSLWTRIGFFTAESKQAKGFLSRSGKQLIDVHQFPEREEHTEPFLSNTLRNVYRLWRLEIVSFLPHLERVLTQFTSPAPELKDLEIISDRDMTDRDIVLPSTIFNGQLPKLTSLSLHNIRTDLRGFNIPSLMRFSFETRTTTRVGNLTSFFERCPLLEFIQIDLCYRPQPPTPPPKRRVCLCMLKELIFEQTACTSGLLDHLILPKCTKMELRGLYSGDGFHSDSFPAARLHPSSIDHLPVTRGITKAIAMPNSCSLSGPNGNLGLWCFHESSGDLDAEFGTSLSPISVLEIRELWVGWNSEACPRGTSRLRKQTAVGIRGAFEVLTKLEDLNIVRCETQPFFATLDVKMDDAILLLGLRRLTVFIGCGDLDVQALIQCAESRKKHFRPLEEVTVVFDEAPGADLVEWMESLRGFVGKLVYRVGEAPQLKLGLK